MGRRRSASCSRHKGLLIQQWDKVQTDMLTIVPTAMPFEQARVAIAD